MILWQLLFLDFLYSYDNLVYVYGDVFFWQVLLFSVVHTTNKTTYVIYDVINFINWRLKGIMMLSRKISTRLFPWCVKDHFIFFVLVFTLYINIYNMLILYIFEFSFHKENGSRYFSIYVNVNLSNLNYSNEYSHLVWYIFHFNWCNFEFTCKCQFCLQTKKDKWHNSSLTPPCEMIWSLVLKQGRSSTVAGHNRYCIESCCALKSRYEWYFDDCHWMRMTAVINNLKFVNLTELCNC